jgi:manganese transport protein
MASQQETSAPAVLPIGYAQPGTPAGHVGSRSLEEMHSSVAVPAHTASFWRQYRAFAGPALLVSVGYMDPGNWATDLQGGAL